MYQRIKQSIYPGHAEDTEQLEDVKIDNCTSNSHRGDESEYKDPSKKISLSNKVSDIFSYIFKDFPLYLASGISNSWFITCCFGIYTKHYLIYKVSKKTPADYNKMVKNNNKTRKRNNVEARMIFSKILSL